MITKFQYIFGSKTKAQEMLYLLHNAKPVLRQGYYEHELPKIEKFCRENNLHLVRSKFKVILTDNTTYSNRGIRIPEKDKREGMYFVYISKDEEKALLAAYYELMQNDKDLGLTLGYPKCCVEFFCQNFNKNNTNLEEQPTNAFTNLTKREQDVVLLSHFPCQSDCPESIALSRKYFHLIKDKDWKRAEELLQNLKV